MDLHQVNVGSRAVICLRYLSTRLLLRNHDFLTEDEYLDILDKLPRENQHLPDEDPQKFIAKMGADALNMLLSRIELNSLSADLRHSADTESSQQRKAEA